MFAVFDFLCLGVILGAASAHSKCPAYTAQEVGLHLKVVTKERLLLALQNVCTDNVKKMLDQLLDKLTTPKAICTYYAECEDNIVKKMKDSITCLPCITYSHITMLLKNSDIRHSLIKYHCQFQPTSYEKIICELGLRAYYNTYEMHGETMHPTDFCFKMGFCHKKFKPKMILPDHYYDMNDDDDDDGHHKNKKKDDNKHYDKKGTHDDMHDDTYNDDMHDNTTELPSDGNMDDKMIPNSKKLMINSPRRGLTDEVV